MRHILQTGCLVLGILCFSYYTGIVIYAGLRSDFAWIWLLGGAFFLLLWRGLAVVGSHPDTPLRFAVRIGFGMLLAGLLVAAVLGSRVVAGMVAQPEADLDYVIVLGAQVRGTRPSRALRKRLDCALEYAEKNPRTRLIVSGGQGPDEDISEAECMYRYLTEHGLEKDRLILEDRSTSTRENLCFSAAYLDKERDRVGILSNNFHICRALLVAEKEGYRKVCGIPAHAEVWMQPHYILREICALLAEKVRGTI